MVADVLQVFFGKGGERDKVMAILSARQVKGATAQPGMPFKVVCFFFAFFAEAQINGAGDLATLQHPLGGDGLREAIARPRGVAAHRAHRPPNAPRPLERFDAFFPLRFL